MIDYQSLSNQELYSKADELLTQINADLKRGLRTAKSIIKDLSIKVKSS